MVCGRDAAFAGVCCSATDFRGVEPLLRVVTGMLEQRWKVECQLERREFQTRSCHEDKGNSIARADKLASVALTNWPKLSSM